MIYRSSTILVVGMNSTIGGTLMKLYQKAFGLRIVRALFSFIIIIFVIALTVKVYGFTEPLLLLDNELTILDKEITIKEAIQIALKYNPQIIMKKAEVEKTRGELKEKKGMQLPGISGNYYITTGNSSNIFSSAYGISPQNFMMAPAKSFYDINFTMMAPVFTGNILSSKVRESVFMVKKEESQLKEMENEVSFKISELYYKALYSKEYLNVIEEWMRLVLAQLERTKELLLVGKAPRADLLRDEAELANVKQSMEEVKAAKEMAFYDLKAYMGIALDSNIKLLSDFESLDSFELNKESGKLEESANIEESINLALNKRPGLIAASHELDAAKERVKGAKGAFWPQVSFMGMYDIFRSSTMGGGNGFSVGLVTSVPLYDGGIRRSLVKQEEAMTDKTKGFLQETRIQVENEVRQSLLQLNISQKNVAASQAALASAREYVRITEIRHEAGKAIKIEVYDALLTQVRASTNKLKALLDLSTAKARFKLAIGQY